MLRFQMIEGMDGYLAAKPLCDEVFCPEQPMDEWDQTAWQLVGYDEDKLIGCARMYKIREGVFQIDRVAVKREYRKAYVGDTLLKVLEDRAVGFCAYQTVVSADPENVGFFEKEGYVPNGEGVLVKDLTKPYKRCKCHAGEQ